MNKKKRKRLKAFLMSSIMLLGMLPVLPGGRITAYAAEPDVTKFATKDDLKTHFRLSDGGSTIGRIKFGADGREWLIAGKDTKNGTLALLSTSSFKDSEYGDVSKYSISTVKGLLEDYTSDVTYFSDGEQAYMADTTVSTLECDQADGETKKTVTDKLYLPDALDRYQGGNGITIYAGANNDIPIALSKLKEANGFDANDFWLRSPDFDNYGDALFAWLGEEVVYFGDVFGQRAVVPVFNLNLSSVIFASAAKAATSDGALTVDDAFTLRYASDGLGSAIINAKQTSVSVNGAQTNTFLVVQNSEGSWVKAVSGDTTFSADDISKGNLTSFENCKVWLEKTDTDRITIATMATVQSGYSVKVVAGKHMTLDSGNDAQNVTVGSPIKNVVYEAEPGYYFPLNYGQDINGITVARTDRTHISVSGWPTANTTTTLKDASATSTRPAAASKKNINLGANVLITGYGEKWISGDTMVYYGHYNGKPVLYRVLEADGDNIALLDSDTVLYTRTFNNSLSANTAQRSGKSNEYNGSDLQIALNDAEFYNKDGVFTSTEQNAIMMSYLGGVDSYMVDKVDCTDYPTYTRIFPLSAKEVVDYYERTKKSDDYWWLRSAYTDALDHAVIVKPDSEFVTGKVNINHVDISPAFNLDLTFVLFTSASGASKSSFDKVKDDQVDDNTWKLTFSDGNTDFDASSSDTKLVVGEENKIEITNISGATESYNYDQITAVLVSQDGEVLYYGKIAEINETSATVTISAGADLTADKPYTLQIFAEQVNANEETDYASNAISFSLDAEKQLQSIKVDKPPNKVEYIEGNTFNPEGLVIKKHYSDNSEETVAYEEATKDSFEFSPSTSTKLKIIDSEITISYTEGGITKEAIQQVNVIAKVVSSIEITSQPDKLSYTAGDALNLNGLSVTLIYNNGETVDIDYADFEAAGITANYKDGEILTSTDNGKSILVTFNEISASAGELSVTPQLYQITAGAGSTYEIGSKTTIQIICSGALSDLTGIYVDDVLLEEVNCTVESGSTILTLNADYLDDLAVGTHTLRFEYLYGSAETTLKVVEAKQAADTTNKTTTPKGKTIGKTGPSAKTGDTASVMLWITLVLLSGMVISGSVWYRKKRRKEISIK